MTQRTRSCVEVAENSFSQPVGFGFEPRADAAGGGRRGRFCDSEEAVAGRLRVSESSLGWYVRACHIMAVLQSF